MSAYSPAFAPFVTLLDPAYVDSPLLKEYGASSLFSADPGKIVLDPVHSTSPVDQLSHDICNSGNILKASAAVHTNYFAAAHPYHSGCMQSSNAAHSPQKDCRKRRTKRRAVLLIATQLNELQAEDPDKILIVRKINRLGFDSADILQKHFEEFGKVSKVRLSNAHQKEHGGHFHVRLRPSGIGFVVFENSGAAAKVLAEGETRVIEGVEVHLRAFERRRFDASSALDCEEEEEVDMEETCSVGTETTRCSSSGSIDLGQE